MKGYFQEAAKAILKSEGLKSISVRKIAEKAGYSFATIYNYFRDVNDLVFLCVEDFQQECIEYVKSNTKPGENAYEQLRSAVIAYARYFIEYPGIFDLFYLEKMGDFGNKQRTIDLINKSFEIATTKLWQDCINQKVINKDKSEFYKVQVQHTLIGALLLYLNRKTPDDYQDFIEYLTIQIDFLFER